ncbi:MAG: aquaporin [Verrucomicrobiae bacterium]|nr:aquaporin [Verrucomicrobiae bacterium]
MKELKAWLAELIGTLALVFVSVGAVYNANHQHFDWLGVALAQGLVVVVMVSAAGAISGGHFNPAVTFGLLVGGKIGLRQVVGHVVSQFIGGVLGGLLSLVIFKAAVISTATPDIAVDLTPAFGRGHAILTEAALTFLWVFVYYGTVVDPRGPKLGGLPVGLSVAAAVLLGGPLTGAGINPARVFGLALCGAHWTNHSVYWFGPILGALLAGIVYGRLLIHPDLPQPPFKR